MKAAVYTKYGPPDVLRIREIEKPAPKDNEILIKVHATTVTSGDARMRGFNVPPGFWLPARLGMGITGPRATVLGTELAGEVEAVGKHVTLFKTGDKVFAGTGMSLGANVEYKSLPEDAAVTLMPSNMSYDEAATIPFGATTALYFLKHKGNIQSDEKVLVYGASGSLGTAGVQLARYFGCEVTGVCSTGNLDLVKSLGADKVIDYTKQDFTKSSATYDIIFDTVGKTSFSGCKKSLTAAGRYAAAVAGLPVFGRMLRNSIFGGRKVIAGVASERKEDLEFLKGIVEAGAYRSVIDRRFPFEKIAEAHRYVELGHKKGNVVLTIC